MAPVGVLRRGLMLLAALQLLSCAGHGTRFVTYVDATRAYGKPGRSRFVLVPADRAMDPKGEPFTRLAAYVERALLAEGYAAADCAPGNLDCPDAELAIFVGYEVRAVAPPQDFYGPVCANPFYYGWGPAFYAPGWFVRGPIGPVCRPYGYFGYGGGYGYASYATRLTLSALDLPRHRRSESPRRPFRVVLATEASVRDPDRVVPVLLAAARGLIGRDSGAELQITIYERDPRVCAVAARRDCPAVLAEDVCERCQEPLQSTAAEAPAPPLPERSPQDEAEVTDGGVEDGALPAHPSTTDAGA